MRAAAQYEMECTRWQGIAEAKGREQTLPASLCDESRSTPAVDSDSERVMQTGRDTDLMTSAPRRRSGAAVVDERLGGAVMTIRRDAAPSGAQIIVRVAVIDRIRRVEIPVQVLVETMFPRRREQIRVVRGAVRIVVVLAARIAHRRAGMPPPDTEIILRREVLGRGKPKAVSLPLVLIIHVCVQLAAHFFPNAADGEPETERILRTDLEGSFVPDVVNIPGRAGGRGVWKLGLIGIVAAAVDIRRLGDALARGVGVVAGENSVEGAVDRAIGADAVARAIHFLVDFVGHGHIDRSGLEFQIRAPRVVEGAVGAGQR